MTVEIRGVDVYDPSTGEVRSRDTDHIALWMIDTNYNEESFFVRHCYFTGGNDPYTAAEASAEGRHRRRRLGEPLLHRSAAPSPNPTPARSPSRSSTTTATKSCKSSRSRTHRRYGSRRGGEGYGHGCIHHRGLTLPTQVRKLPGESARPDPWHKCRRPLRCSVRPCRAGLSPGGARLVG